eukprot:646985_1
MVSLYISVFSLFIASISISDQTSSQAITNTTKACSDEALAMVTNAQAQQYSKFIGASASHRLLCCAFIDKAQNRTRSSASYLMHYSLSFPSIELVYNSTYLPCICSHVNIREMTGIRHVLFVYISHVQVGLVLFLWILSSTYYDLQLKGSYRKHTSLAFLIPSNLIRLTIVSTLIIRSTALYFPTYVNGSYPMVLPRPDRGMAIGYDAANHTVLILGGYYRFQLVTFKNSVFTDHGGGYLFDPDNGDFSARSSAQFYTQMDDTLWYINCMHGNLVTFNTITYNMFDPNITTPIKIVDDTSCNARSCLASLDNGKHQYLFVIGFEGPNYVEGDKVQIYNISSSHWLSQSYVPNMNKKRESLSCVVYNERLYAIGGREPFSGSSGNPLDTVESLYVGADLSNINNALWLYANGVLSQTMSGTRAVVHHEFHSIIVIPAVFQVDVNIINTVDSSISFAGTLTQGTTTAASIIVDDLLYLFGGNANGYRVDTYQYINLLTLAPTASSNAPSNAPSDAPSNAPSKPPSKAPSSAPSNAPSDAPSNAPTAPTNVPSNAPSNAPSPAPSLSPAA